MIGPQALYVANGDGAAKAHRCIPAGPPRLAIIEGRRQRCAPIRILDQAGTREALVPCADLVPAEPLSDADERECRRLDAQLAGTIGEARTLKRFNQLRLRSLVCGSVG